MIDLTNKPEGATGYYDGPMAITFYRGGKYWNDLRNEWVISGSDKDWHAKNVVAIEREWTIYNNDQPLSELSDEQVGAILRYGIENGVIEVRDDNGKWWDNLSLVGWHTALAYRAKQKSERELFVEAAMKFCIGGKRAEDTFSDMFNAGFKAPKVGE